ncbi:MAG: thioredoxin family protein [Bacteroidales bacterium]|nr:thioredoxin family protein [Bacteroidales bacterium]MCF8328619.1 thioredoxin family protein [Bacteroidales bacterium]
MKVILLLAVFIGIATTVSAQQGLEVGDKAIDFNLLNVDGEYVSLEDYQDKKGVVVIFTCNHCPYAQAWEQRIIDLHQDYAGKGYPVVAINPNDSNVVAADSYTAMQQRAEEKNYPFPYLLDAKQNIFPAYGATKTPHVYLLENIDNEFIVRYIGAVDNNYKAADKVSETYLADAIDALIAGEKPEPESTKAIGCSIKVEDK